MSTKTEAVPARVSAQIPHTIFRSLQKQSTYNTITIRASYMVSRELSHSHDSFQRVCKSCLIHTILSKPFRKSNLRCKSACIVGLYCVYIVWRCGEQKHAQENTAQPSDRKTAFVPRHGVLDKASMCGDCKAVKANGPQVQSLCRMAKA